MNFRRFRDSLSALQDCERHIGDSNLSMPEMKARKELVFVCRRIVALDGEYEED